jgi:alpha/beta superfamily hydrolase
MADIRANTVLPARREAVTLETTDGLRLVGELALPEATDPVATLVMLHPLPTEGGMMDSHLLRKAAWRLPALADLAVLRFNTRGTSSEAGTSEGEFDNGEAERFDVAAALDLVEFRDLPAPWLVGWSFGTDLALRYGCDPSVVGAVLISPPLRFSTPADLDIWAESGRPLTAIVPEFDDYLRPAEARERFAVVPQCEVVAVPGAKHLFVGYAETVLDAVVRAVSPARSPLPRVWPDAAGDGAHASS